MKKILLVLLLSPFILSAQEATIKLDILRQLGDIDRNIYGVFMEPIRNSLDGLLYDPQHPLANKDGFRTDFIDAAKELQISNMRWPGGNYLASYDWRDGIGPVDQRPVRRELAWNVIDRNRVGTDEWFKLSNAMGVDNSICINAGTGTVNDARYWLEYVNSPQGSYYADLRAKYGHPKPYNVKYWHLGNEVDGEPWQAVAFTSQEYVTFAKDAANIMYYVNRGCDSCTQPSFIVMGSSWVVHNGEERDWSQWNWDVINGLIKQKNVDYIALHRYWGSGLNRNIQNDFSPNVYLGDWERQFNEYLTTTENQIAIAKVKNNVLDKPFHIAFTEWSPRGSNHMRTLAGALHFNNFIRHANSVKRANYTMLTGLLSRDSLGNTYKSSFFYMFKLFSTNVKGKSLDPYVKCATFDGKVYKNIPYLDVSSSYSENDKKLVINVVNRNMDKAITTNIISDSGNLKGRASISTINTNDVNTPFNYAQREQYKPANSSQNVSGKSFIYAFPPHSFTQIIVELSN